jgi:hypothetical protein
LERFFLKTKQGVLQEIWFSISAFYWLHYWNSYTNWIQFLLSVSIEGQRKGCGQSPIRLQWGRSVRPILNFSEADFTT